MASPTAIRAGLAQRLATISTFSKTYATAPGQPVVPCAIVLPGPIEFDDTMGRGVDMLHYDVVVLVQKATDQIAQENLDPYLAGSGTTSVKEAVEDTAIAIAGVDWVRVTGVSMYGDVDYAGIQYLGARFPVEVNADGS